MKKSLNSADFLTKEQLDIITFILDLSGLQNAKIEFFGSRVTRENRKYSDLDMLITGSRPLDVKQIRILKRNFEDCNLPFRVDFHDGHYFSI